MKAPITVKEAEIVAEKLGVGVGDVMVVYDILSKEDLVLDQQIASAEDSNKLWAIYDEASQGGLVRMHVLEKILPLTTDLDELWDLHDCALGDSQLQAKVLEKINQECEAQLALAQTLEELWDIHDHTPEGSAVEAKVFEKIEQVCKAQLALAQTPEDLWNIIDNLSSGPTWRQASEKLVDLTTDLDELWNIFENSNIPEEDALAVKIFEKILALAENTSQLWALNGRINSGNPIEDKIFEKIIVLAGTGAREDLEKVFSRGPSREIRVQAFKKMVELI